MRRRRNKWESPPIPTKSRDARLVEKMFDKDRDTSGRTCGSCTACCTALRVRLDGPEGPNTVVKPQHVACRHLLKKNKRKHGGCGIYGEHPYDCRIYGCYWLEGFGEAKDRPDRLGLILDSADGIIEGIWRLTGIKCITVHEVWPGVSTSKRVRAAISGIVSLNLGVIYHGTGKLPPVIAAPDVLPKIEAALDTLEAASRAVDAHVAGEHSERVENCPVCLGVCPSHVDHASPICSVCAAVWEATPAS